MAVDDALELLVSVVPQDTLQTHQHLPFQKFRVFLQDDPSSAMKFCEMTVHVFCSLVRCQCVDL